MKNILKKQNEKKTQTNTGLRKLFHSNLEYDRKIGLIRFTKAVKMLGWSFFFT